MNIIARKTKEIHLSSEFFNFKLDMGNNSSIEIDLKSLFNSEDHNEDAWINITPLLKIKKMKGIKDWTRNLNVREYINARILKDLKPADPTPLKGANSLNYSHLKSTNKKVHYEKSMWLSKKKNDWLVADCPLIVTRAGKYHSGTWIHKNLFLKFITILDVNLEIAMHDMVMDIIKHSKVLKVDRADTKHLFKDLTKTIKDIYIPKQSENGQKFAYSTLANLVNKKAIGMNRKQYCKLNKLDDKLPIRDTFPEDALQSIKNCEVDLNGLIKYAKITDYEVLKLRFNEI